MPYTASTSAPRPNSARTQSGCGPNTARLLQSHTACQRAAIDCGVNAVANSDSWLVTKPAAPLRYPRSASIFQFNAANVGNNHVSAPRVAASAPASHARHGARNHQASSNHPAIRPRMACGRKPAATPIQALASHNGARRRATSANRRAPQACAHNPVASDSAFSAFSHMSGVMMMSTRPVRAMRRSNSTLAARKNNPHASAVLAALSVVSASRASPASANATRPNHTYNT